MPVQTNELTPEYGWNLDAKRYVDLSTGRFVSQAQVRTALDRSIASAKDGIDDISRDLVDGRISLATWQTRMAGEIKLIHLASGAAAAGGWAQLTQSDYGRIGAALRKQYQYLQNFALQIESGAVKLDGRLLVRAGLYGEAGRGTYEELRRAAARAGGMDQERRVLGAAEHCPDCVRLAGMGWRRIGSLPRIGQSQCRTNCKCTFVFRRLLTAEEIGGFGL